MGQSVKKYGRILLGCISLAVAYAVLSATPSHAITLTPSGDIAIDGLVAGPPPDTPPTIEKPVTGDTFTEKSITVEGTCISDLIVRVYRNNTFAGSALCQDGRFSLSIDLFIGRNDLYARQFDSINQASPASNTVTVYYSPPSPTPPLPEPEPPVTPPADDGGTQAPGSGDEDVAQFQLIIDYDYTMQAIFAGQPFYLPVKFVGGTGPYAVSIHWGDGTSDVYSRDTTKQFTIDHIYEKAGFYTVTIKVSDKNNDTASLQFVIIVNGQEKPSFFTEPLAKGSFGWWWTTIAAIVVISWIGAFLLGKLSGKTKRKN